MPQNPKEDALEALAARRWRVAAALTTATLVSYFGFILLIAFDKPLMGKLIAPGLSLGILLGAVVIGLSWGFTGLYVLWANSQYDREIHRLGR
jgi:uncharacterized membrane protein (DUF485 family)